MASEQYVPLYTRIPKSIKEYIDEYCAQNGGISISEAVSDHLIASKGKVVRGKPGLVEETANGTGR